MNGGLRRERTYLLDGDPGSGKTTLSLQFLLEEVRNGERCMFVSLSETKEELEASAESHGWSLEGINVLEICASEESLKLDGPYTMYRVLPASMQSRFFAASGSGSSAGRAGQEALTRALSASTAAR